MRTTIEFKKNETAAMLSMIEAIADEMGEKAQAKVAEYSMKMLSGYVEYEEKCYLCKEISVFSTPEGFRVVVDINDEVVSDVFRFFRRSVRIIRPFIEAGKAIAKAFPGVVKELEEAFEDLFSKHVKAVQEEKNAEIRFDMKFGVYCKVPYVVIYDAITGEIEDIAVKYKGNVFSVGAYDEEDESLHKIFLHCMSIDADDITCLYSKEDVIRLSKSFLDK